MDWFVFFTVLGMLVFVITLFILCCMIGIYVTEKIWNGKK